MNETKENIEDVLAVNSDVKEHNGLSEVYDWLQSIVLAIFAFLVLFTFIVRVITVDGDSMVPTLHNEQRLLVSGLGYTPNYGDIVIVQANELKNNDGTFGKPIVKRVIGLAGDKIRIDFMKGVVYRNDKALEENYTNTPTNLIESMKNNEEVIVPDGCVFVLGDNRNNSKDSRSDDVGMIDTRNIVGKALYRIFPIDTLGSVY